MRLKFFQKIIVWLVMAGILSGSFMRPQTAQAVLPVFDVDAVFQLTAANVSLADIAVNTTASAGLDAAQETQTLLEWGKKVALSILKKQLLDRLVDKIIEWINGGNVKAKIVGDWKEFLREAGNAAVGDLAKEVGAGLLCSPFNFQINIVLNPVQKFSSRVTCTLDDIVGNIQNFYSDFRNGGWIAYQESWQPQNNIFGLALLAVDEAAKREDAAKTAAQSEAVAGGGFLSSKECDAQGRCRIITPGKLVGETVSEILVKTPISTILSAQDIADYATAVADAAINKLVKTGVEKLLNQ